MKKKLPILIIITSILIICTNVKKSTAQWVLSGPEGGYIKCMTQSGNNIYAVSNFFWFTSAGFYSSSDDGNSWNSINSASLPADIRDIVSLGNSLFIGTGSGVYRSDDYGLTWVEKTNGFPFGDKWINHLAISGSTIFAAGTSSGMLRSLDNGEHWTVINTGLTDNYIYSMTANETAVFAGTGDQNLGVFRSTDNGNTWQQVKNGMGYYYDGNWIYSEAPKITSLSFIGTDLYAGTAESQGIWKSSDYGDNWVFTSMETMNYSEITDITGNESVLLAGSTNVDGGGVIRSVNGGINWTDANNGIGNHGRVNTFLNRAGNIFVATKGGIYKTSDSGENWSGSGSGIYSQNVAAPGFAGIGSELFVSTYFGGVFKSQDGGNSWIESNNGLPINTWDGGNLFSTSTALFSWDRVSFDGGNSWDMSINYSPGTVGPDYYGPRWLEHGGAWFAISWNQNAGMYRSTDNGQNWTLLTNGLPDPFTTPFVQVSSDETNLFLSTEGGVYYSADNGDNWNLSAFNPPVGFNINRYAGGAFNAGNSTLIMTPGGLYNSTDQGASWNMLHYWAPITDYAISFKKYFKSGNITYSQGEYSYWDDMAGRVYVNNFYMSPDEGVTWTNITADFQAVNVTSFVYEASNIYVIGKSNNIWSIYRSSDQGTSWVNINQSFPNSLATILFIYGDQIFAGTNGSSVWKRNLNEFAAPAQPGAISGIETPCSGTTEIYSVENVADVTYQWQFPADWVILTGNGSNSVTVQVGSQSGIVLVIPSNVFGSGPSQYLLVEPTLGVQPTVAIEADQNDICDGEQMTFSTLTTNGGDQPEYNWYVNDQVQGENLPSFNYVPQNGDIVSLSFTSSLGCTTQNPVTSNNITAIVKAAPQVSWSDIAQDTFCINSPPILLTGGLPEGGIYSGAGIFANNFDPSIAGEGNHELIYTYVNEAGCSNHASQVVNVNLCSGVSEINAQLLVYPNPATNAIYIESLSGQRIEGIELVSIMGETVISQTEILNTNIISIPVQNISSGLYILRVIYHNSIATKSIVLK